MNIVTRNWRDLIRPRGIQIENETLTEFYGKFSCEPLERGFGITLGNSLRRILLSSLQGAAISAVKIDGGALHEFTTISDVVEDVTDIILNLKEVVIKAAQAKTYSVRIDKEGPGPVYAKDIQLVDGLQVLNPDHLVATLDKKGPLSMELSINVGRGYVPAEKNKTATMSIGTIPIDSLFSPIRKVNYTVTNARVGQVTDYDKLTLEVWTNGTVKPAGRRGLRREDPEGAAHIFINFEETEKKKSPTSAPPKTSRSTRTSSARSTRSSCVRAQLLGEREHHVHRRVRSATEQDMLKTKNFGARASRRSRRSLPTWGSRSA